jgi:mannose-6-phosphate isomerase-like protein (cupin superfamily)
LSLFSINIDVLTADLALKEKPMHKVAFGLGIVVGALALSVANQVQLGGQAPAGSDRASAATRFPPGKATYMSHDEIMKYVGKRTGSKPLAETMLRVANIGGQYNVGIAVMNRVKGKAESGPEHYELTEVYHILSGTATLVTGGTYTPPITESSSINRIVIGPGRNGAKVSGGESQRIGPGDIIIIPPNTPHYFSEIASDELVYIMDRIDTGRYLKLITEPLVYPDDPLFQQK